MNTRLRCRTRGVIAGGLVLSLAVLSQAGPMPDVVELASLAQFYDRVEFDHALHVDVADGCSTCHHHTTGGAAEREPCTTCHDGSQAAATVVCKDCHYRDPFSPEHIVLAETGDQWFHVDKPGLKGAYHQNCLGCHQETGAPTGCQDCHARNAAGDALFRAGTGPRQGPSPAHR